MLTPMSAGGRLLLLAQNGSDGLRGDGRQAVADFFCEGLADPPPLVAALVDAGAARRVIGALTGEWWLRSVVAGALGVVGSQLRKKLLRGVR
jgi:hypothetical protein